MKNVKHCSIIFSNTTNLENVIMRWFMVYPPQLSRKRGKNVTHKVFMKIIVRTRKYPFCCHLYFSFFCMWEIQKKIHMHFLFHMSTAELLSIFLQRSAKNFTLGLTQLLIPPDWHLTFHCHNIYNFTTSFVLKIILRHIFQFSNIKCI